MMGTRFDTATGGSQFMSKGTGHSTATIAVGLDNIPVRIYTAVKLLWPTEGLEVVKTEATP
jgi:hypothetical protein